MEDGKVEKKREKAYLRFRRTFLILFFLAIGIVSINIINRNAIKKESKQLYEGMLENISQQVGHSMDLYFEKYKSCINSIANSDAFKTSINVVVSKARGIARSGSYNTESNQVSLFLSDVTTNNMSPVELFAHESMRCQQSQLRSGKSACNR